MKISYTYDEVGNYIDINAWTFLDDGTIVECEIEEYAYEEECKLLGDDADVLKQYLRRFSKNSGLEKALSVIRKGFCIVLNITL